MSNSNSADTDKVGFSLVLCTVTPVLRDHYVAIVLS